MKRNFSIKLFLKNFSSLPMALTALPILFCLAICMSIGIRNYYGYCAYAGYEKQYLPGCCLTTEEHILRYQTEGIHGLEPKFSTQKENAKCQYQIRIPVA